ncbi:glycosyltransferase [Microbacterium paludicola]|uniref:Glycosyltransferase n=2 Tax=Microbacterium paludicola TaxID=300019 RepID=A0A4Y9FSV6_9MICO|nr:glycosyltransferase [Microbacterium paludicola]TFU32305.1 glycosyltransferase [Microbacterium paludicola]
MRRDAPIEFASRRRRPGHSSSAMTLLVVIATIGIVAYAGFLLDPRHRGDWIPYILVIAAETILICHALLSMWTILAGGGDPRDFAYHVAQGRLLTRESRGDDTIRLHGKEVLVDVFVTVYGEDLDTVRRTVTAAVALRGRHRTWVLDDGHSDEVRAMAAETGAWYVRRLTSTGAKAGNINHALSLAKGDFFVIFDADFVPSRQFLFETLPFFADESVAFVQTPQAYGNLHTVIARGAAYMQTVFYRFIQPGRNRFNAAMCVGTNVVFRRTAIDEIGGMHTDSKSEDVWTSILLHERGWRSVFLRDVLAIGEAPETIEAYSRQQLRWATGGFEILFQHNPLSPRRRLTVDQRIQYFVTATFYLTGICPLLLLVVPPLEIYFELRPMHLDITVLTWLLYYAGFYVLQIGLAWFAVGSFRWETLTLATVSFPIYTKALVNVIAGRDEGWHVTGRSTTRSPFNFIIPQTLFLVFLALTTLVGIWRDIDNGTPTLATAWNATNTVILAAFIATAWHEARAGIRRTGVVAIEAETESAPLTVIARPPAPEPVRPAAASVAPANSPLRVGAGAPLAAAPPVDARRLSRADIRARRRALGGRT